MTIQAWVLMTALPPTTGHGDLVEFASHCAERVNVVLCTQPSEPLADERLAAVQAFASRPAFSGAVKVHHIHDELPQEPGGADDFWSMWTRLLVERGASAGDVVVASEPYGADLARAIDGTSIPFDPDRQINPAKATKVRLDTLGAFGDILPEFQPFLRKTVTLFGAESVGKSTVTRRLDELGIAVALPEWARSYLELEAVGPVVTASKMQHIWRGQRALQLTGEAIASRRGLPVIAQDTDLLSTVGYWELMGAEFGEPTVPAELWDDAIAHASDLYVILSQRDVPFAPDPLRYGGDHRESSDEFWISLCERAQVPWVVVDGADLEARVSRVVQNVQTIFGAPLAYTRRGREYASSGEST